MPESSYSLSSLFDVEYSSKEGPPWTVDLITLRSKTDNKSNTPPVHTHPLYVALVQGMGALGDRAFGFVKPKYNQEITLMDFNVIKAIRACIPGEHMPGDTFLVDGPVHTLKPGDKLYIGSAEVAITPDRHTACGKFVHRFGKDAAKWVNNRGYRGVKARIIKSGIVSVGDELFKGLFDED